MTVGAKRFCTAVFVVIVCALSASTARTQVQEGTRPVPGTNLASLFNVGGNLGFATIRLAYANPNEPLPQPVVDWLMRDLPSGRQWAGAVSSCVPFDLARFDQLMDAARSGRPSREIFPLVDRLHRDYTAAVGQAQCTMGLQSNQQLQAFFTGSLFMGFAVARASYFTGGPPLSSAVIGQIIGDVPAIKAGLGAVTTCTPAVGQLHARLDSAVQRMGSVGGEQSWQDLVGEYQAIEGALREPTCASKPPSPPAGEQSCKDTKCGVPCKGAVTMLGVVSGSPECMACLAQFCKVPDALDRQ